MKYVFLTLFLCQPGAQSEAYCGPSTGNYEHTSEASCMAAGRAYRQAQEDAGLALPGAIRFTCWEPGMGYRK